MVTFHFYLDAPYKRDPESQEKIKALKKGGKPVLKSLLSDKETTIYLIVTFPKGLVGGKAAKIVKLATEEKTYPKYWDFKGKMPNSHAPDTIELTDRLDDFKTKIKNAYKDYTKSLAIFAFEKVKEQLQRAADPSYIKLADNNFWEVWDKFIEQSPKIKSDMTRAKYRSQKKMLQEFEKKKGYIISFDTINSEFLNILTKYLREEHKHKNNKGAAPGLLNNTLAKHLTKIKTVCTWAHGEGYHKNIFYTKISPSGDPVEAISLEFEEFTQILHFIPDSQEIEEIKDKYITQILTGQRFEDINSLERTDIKNGVWHLYQRKGRKTQVIEIPLHPIILTILAKYEDREKPLPEIKLTDYNEGIKELGRLAGIDSIHTRVRYKGDTPIKETSPKYQFLTSHVARKTFINVCCELGIEISVVMSITGSKDLSVVMEHYRKVQMKQKQKEINEKLVFDNPIMKVS